MVGMERNVSCKVYRCSTDGADAADIELQILSTEHDNVTQLLCTKSRRTRNAVRKVWRRDFFYDEDSLLVTPLHKVDARKQDLVARLSLGKEAKHSLVNELVSVLN